MAFLVKNVNKAPTSNATWGVTPVGEGYNQTAPAGLAALPQWIYVKGTAKLVPQSTTDQIFRVFGGRVMVYLLIGEVTTVMPATDAQVSVLSKALTVANPPVAIGTATTIASTVTTANREVGGTFVVEGDSTALVAANAGAAFLGLNGGPWIAPAGEIYLSSAASSVTGIIRWDMWYQPLDEGAYVEPVSVAVVAI